MVTNRHSELTNFQIQGYYNTKSSIQKVFPALRQKCCPYKVAAEQKARVTYDNILRMVDDPDVIDPIRFLREREIVHFQRFGESLRIVQDNLNSKNFYAINPEFDKKEMCGCKQK